MPDLRTALEQAMAQQPQQTQQEPATLMKRVWHTINKHPNVTTVELSHMLNHQLSSISSATTNLFRRDMVERHRNENLQWVYVTSRRLKGQYKVLDEVRPRSNRKSRKAKSQAIPATVLEPLEPRPQLTVVEESTHTPRIIPRAQQKETSLLEQVMMAPLEEAHEIYIKLDAYFGKHHV